MRVVRLDAPRPSAPPRQTERLVVFVSDQRVRLAVRLRLRKRHPADQVEPVRHPVPAECLPVLNPVAYLLECQILRLGSEPAYWRTPLPVAVERQVLPAIVRRPCLPVRLDWWRLGLRVAPAYPALP